MVSITEAERIRAERLRERAGPGRQRQGSVAARPLPQRGRRKAEAERIGQWTLAYDIMGPSIYNTMYDIIGVNYDMIVMISYSIS
jgi:hypothetical protein